MALQFSDERTFKYPDLFTVYARHFWQDQYPVMGSLQASIRKYLISRWREIDRQTLSQQALLIINSMAYFDPRDSIYQKAQEQLDNLRQSAITDADNGTRWKDIADADDLNTATEETVGLLAEAFHETSYYPELRSGLIKWLLQANTDHHWQSTKATAAAIALLCQAEGALAAPPQNLNARIGDSAFDLSNNLIQGQSFVFMPTTATATDIHLHQPGFSPVAGNIVAYSFTSGERLNLLNQSVQLHKTLYLYDNSRHDWVPLTESTVVHIADRIKIVLTLESAKPLRYVYIDDKRAAAFEPIEARSEYTAESGFPLYHSIRDIGDQFFAEFIPSGRWNISYEVKAAYEGTFTNGPAVLQCMYKPEIAAYSNSSIVVIF